MEITEIKSVLDKQGEAFTAFKEAQDAVIAEQKKRGAADAVLVEKVDRINEELQSLSELKTRVDSIETAANREKLGGDPATRSDQDKAFAAYLRKGDNAPEAKAMSVLSDPDGGYVVTPQMSSKIITIIRETSPMRQLASVETISTDALEFIEDRDEAALGGWVGELAARNDSNSPQVGKRMIAVGEMYSQPKASQKLLDDASVDIERWLAAKVADKFARTENTAFISGSQTSGIQMPRGILTYASGTAWGQIEQVGSGSSGAVTADGLLSLLYALKEGYQTNATFLMQRALVLACRKLKDTTNQYLWQPNFQAGQPDLLIGKPVVMAADMPSAGSGSLSIACGDFKQGYQIVDRLGIRVLRDPFTDKPNVKFYTTKRVGGDVINFGAIKLQVLS